MVKRDLMRHIGDRMSQIYNLCIVTNLLFVHCHKSIICNEVIECYKHLFCNMYITCKLSVQFCTFPHSVYKGTKTTGFFVTAVSQCIVAQQGLCWKTE